MSDYIAVALAKVFIFVVLVMGIVAFVQDFVL